jgi:hypothetical protein
MDGPTSLLLVLAIVAIVAIVAFSLGTRSRVSTGGGCTVDVYWWMGWWARCAGGDACPPGERCTLPTRRRGTEEQWAEPAVVPGGSVRWNKLGTS